MFIMVLLQSQIIHQTDQTQRVNHGPYNYQ